MTNKKKRIIHSPEFKAETLKLAEKVESLRQPDSSPYMNLRSTLGARLPRKTPQPVNEN